MRFQVCCETGVSRLKMIMTKMRNNLLVVTLDALLMLSINGPSLEPDKPSPTIELSELCKLGYLHWTKAKNRNPNKCHHVSRAHAEEPSAAHHSAYRDAPVFSLLGPCAWYPVQAAFSDVGIRDRTWRTGTRRLRTVTAAGTAGDGQHTDNGAKRARASETRL